MVQNEIFDNNIEQPTPTLSMNPQKFALWLFIITIVMIFASLTSAYIVRQADSGWLDFNLPKSLWINSGILILSSITMHWAFLSAKNNNINILRISISITTVLGMMFLAGQIFSKEEIELTGIGFTTNPSVSFLYVLAGVHGLHLIAGIIFLIIVLILSFRFKIHCKNLTTIQMCATFWHFLDLLWIYLFVFLLMNQG